MQQRQLKRNTKKNLLPFGRSTEPITYDAAFGSSTIRQPRTAHDQKIIQIKFNRTVLCHQPTQLKSKTMHNKTKS